MNAYIVGRGTDVTKKSISNAKELIVKYDALKYKNDLLSQKNLDLASRNVEYLRINYKLREEIATLKEQAAKGGRPAGTDEKTAQEHEKLIGELQSLQNSVNSLKASLAEERKKREEAERQREEAEKKQAEAEKKQDESEKKLESAGGQRAAEFERKLQEEIEKVKSPLEKRITELIADVEKAKSMAGEAAPAMSSSIVEEKDRAIQTLNEEIKGLKRTITRLTDTREPVVKRTLLINDTKGSCLGIKEIIEGEQLEITVVDSGEQALKMMEKEEFDLLFTDIALSGVSGIYLYKFLQKAKPHVVDRIIFLLDDAGQKAAAGFLSQTGVKYFHRPVNSEEFVSYIRRLKKPWLFSDT